MKNSAKIIMLFVTHLLVLIPMIGWGQDYNQIVSSREYLYGEGKAASAVQADRLALSIISEQISVAVTSEIKIHHLAEAGKSQSQINDIIKTYSSATLTNCEKWVLENGPKQYRVLRYVHKDEIKRIFKAREQKVLEMINIGVRAEEEKKYDVALKHLYWAQILLETVMHPNEVYCKTPQGEMQAVVWLPLEINKILDGLSFIFGGYTTEEKTHAIIYVTYDNVPVTSLDYTYWDGISWSAPTQAKDGLGAVEFRSNTNVSSIDVKVEYAYDQEMQIDPDLRNFAEFLAPKHYTKAYKNSVKLSAPQMPSQAALQNDKVWEISDVVLNDVDSAGGVNNVEESITTIEIVKDVTPYKKTLSQVEWAINNSKYGNIRNLFTAEGYEIFSKLIEYGRARTISGSGFNPIDEIEVAKFDNHYYCRSIPMQFSFPTYNKCFVENVVFEFDGSGKISALQFGLEQTSINDILKKKQWSADAKLIIIHFLENYKTAFALERLGYLDSVFSEDALIIVGRVVKRTQVEGMISLQNQEYVEYSRQNKKQYIKNLSRSFDSKEYINLQFSNLRITKMGRGDRDVYCIEIKQDYYSSNYADTGYLMLVVDVTDSNRPIIHARTWQPKPDPTFGLFVPGHV